jgi:ERCC4-type nuclease
MKLYIDNREPKNSISYLESLNTDFSNQLIIEIKPLEIGDYMYYDEDNSNNNIIFERKSLSDLESSIKDGRYNEQSLRLSQSYFHNHNIIYLVEGAIINYRNKKFKNTLYSSIFSLNHYKGFSVFNTLNNVDTCDMLYNFILKKMKEKTKPPFYNNIINQPINKFINETHNNLDESNNINYLSTIKTTKKDNITKDNINTLMLMQIPGISLLTASSIMNKYNNIYNLINELKKDFNCLDSLKLEASNRKISKNIIENVKNYLLTLE